MLVGDGGSGGAKVLHNGDCGGAALLTTACGTFRGRSSGEESLGAERLRSESG